jgi:hypothetical protein
MVLAWRLLDHLLDPHFDLPASREVVLIEEALGGTESELCQPHCRSVLVKARPADIGDAVIAAMNAKAVQVIVVPAHEQLDDPVQVRDRQAVRKLDPPPNGGMNVPQQELQPQQQRRALFDHRPTLDHRAEPAPVL